MIDYGLFEFACPPGVGEEWFVAAAAACGLGDHQFIQAYVPFKFDTKKLKVSLVRNPRTWIVRNHETKKDLSSFPAYIHAYFQEPPGRLGRMAAFYEADTVLRIEDMPWAFIDLARAAGIPKDMRDRVLYIPKLKLTTFPLPPSLIELVANSERAFMERYDYY